VEINKHILFPYIIYNKPFQYNKFITLNPIKMKDIVVFQQYQEALTLRKDAIFREKKIIKMSYLEFIKYSFKNIDLANQYRIPLLPLYYDFIINLFIIACGEKAEIKYNPNNLDFYINDCMVTDSMFDELRKILIIQNDIDFDVDEFMNIDTVKAFEKAREFEAKKNKEKSNIEDYIDSVIVALHLREEDVEELTIRKFWRYVQRINKHENYNACKSGEMGGMVTFKEPIQHWMTSIESEDKYEKYKTDEDELRSKVEG